jgi:hypothetical protein
MSWVLKRIAQEYDEYDRPPSLPYLSLNEDLTRVHPTVIDESKSNVNVETQETSQSEKKTTDEKEKDKTDKADTSNETLQQLQESQGSQELQEPQQLQEQGDPTILVVSLKTTEKATSNTPHTPTVIIIDLAQLQRQARETRAKRVHLEILTPREQHTTNVLIVRAEGKTEKEATKATKATKETEATEETETTEDLIPIMLFTAEHEIMHIQSYAHTFTCARRIIRVERAAHSTMLEFSRDALNAPLCVTTRHPSSHPISSVSSFSSSSSSSSVLMFHCM